MNWVYRVGMGIRLKAMLIIILTNLLIIIFSVSVGSAFTGRNIDFSLETDLEVMAKIADRYISSELENLRLKADATALLLAENSEPQWREILARQNNLYHDFLGLAIISEESGLISASGKYPAPAEIAADKNISKAFSGGKPFSSTIPSPGGVVFYAAVPIPSAGSRILIVTIPGMYFSDLLSRLVIWKTGYIFISDSEGYVIANIREQWVQERNNFIHLAKQNGEYTNLAKIITRMTKGETGIGYYAIDEVPRTCAFTSVSGSKEGWSLGVVVPLPENPARNTDRGFLVVALAAIFLSILAAIVASNFIGFKGKP